MKKGLLFLLGVMLLVSIGFSSAQVTNDFYASAPASVDVCGCAVAEKSVTVRNTGDFTNLFRIEQSGSASPYVTVFPSTFVLEPGQEIEVSELFSAHCGLEGAFELKTVISNDLNIEKQFTQVFNAEKCNNIGLSASSPAPGCRCSTFEYEAFVQNTKGFIETYNFAVDKFYGETVILPSSAVLSPGEEIKVLIYTTPDCSEKGIKNFNFITTAVNNNLQQKVPLQLDIVRACYAYAQPSSNVTYEFPKLNFSMNLTGAKLLPGTLCENNLVKGLIILPLVIVIILIIIALVKLLVKRRGEKLPVPKEVKLEKKKPYKWEKMFREEKKLKVPKVSLPKFKINWRAVLSVLLAIIIIAALVAGAYFLISAIRSAPEDGEIQQNITEEQEAPEEEVPEEAEQEAGESFLTKTKNF
ncbi:hypothetical protein JXB11_00015, partial [Candidatus Woesearchaeota archaeon]|nr:hypothetical protein [Candidatus Woesearchaeota archaeon]